MTLSPAEFMRRFLLHVLPDGFQRIRHYGFLANGNRTAKLARIRELLPPAPQQKVVPATQDAATAALEPECTTASSTAERSQGGCRAGHAARRRATAGVSVRVMAVGCGIVVPDS
jgi:hypothetical protein